MVTSPTCIFEDCENHLPVLEGAEDKAAEYRQLLIQSIHVTAVKFSEIAASVVHALMEFLGDAGSSSALHVVAFVRCAFIP